MGEELVGRRGWLRGVGVGGGLAVAALVTSAGSAAAKDGDKKKDHKDDTTGSWLVEALNDDDDETLSVVSFAAGGVAVVHDIQPAGPPWTGTWEADDEEFKATVWTGFPGEEGPGSVGPTAWLRLEGEYDDDDLSGTFEAKILAPDGAEVDTITGSFSGSRIEA